MATSQDESSLLRYWDREFLGRYEGTWIAWRYPEGVLMNHEELPALTQEFGGAMESAKGPLFAFVTFKRRA